MAIVKLKQVDAASVRQQGALAHNDVHSLEDLVIRLKAAGLYRAPLDMAAVAEFLGLPMRAEVMDDDMSGFLEGSNGRWRIGYNAYHNVVRQRFTIAHEIAHYVLHRHEQNRFDDVTFARRNTSRNRMEAEADRFAAELLMPAELVRAAVASGIKTLNELATYFRVSSIAMKYRLQQLHYILK